MGYLERAQYRQTSCRDNIYESVKGVQNSRLCNSYVDFLNVVSCYWRGLECPTAAKGEGFLSFGLGSAAKTCTHDHNFQGKRFICRYIMPLTGI